MVTRSAVVSRLLELFRFGSVGAVAFVVDMGLFNLLMFGPGQVLGHKPLTSKVISVVVATLVSWLGNRYWTFRRDRHTYIAREFVEFVTASLLGLAVTLGCLWFTHHVLGLTSLLADNISGNVIGLGLGTAVRFVLYRYWVWRPRREVGEPDLEAELELESERVA